jgi:hypothetical protein
VEQYGIAAIGTAGSQSTTFSNSRSEPDKQEDMLVAFLRMLTDGYSPTQK